MFGCRRNDPHYKDLPPKLKKELMPPCMYNEIIVGGEKCELQY